MKRRELFKAAAIIAAADLPDAGSPWPSAQKLGKQKRETLELLAKVRLANSDAPDGLPRAPLPRRRK
jgi:hypothetical protein